MAEHAADMSAFEAAQERDVEESAGELAGWQPINTAPTDMTEVIGINERGRVYRTWFFAPSSQTRDWLRVPGNAPWRPTHWMPLPKPPATLTARDAATETRNG
jgi:hypothetical protein